MSNVVPLNANQQIYPMPYPSPGYYPGCYPPSGCGCCPPQCNYPPPPAPTPTPIQAPIIGVTNGSDAAPGIVGEFVTASQTFSFAASPTNNTINISLMVLQPGDWDLRAVVGVNVVIGPIYFDVRPMPVGLSNNMAMYASITSVAAGASGEAALFQGQIARGSFATPTLIPFYINIDNSTAGFAAGNGLIRLDARRMR